MKPIAIVIHHEGASNGFSSVNEYHRKKFNFKSSLGYWAGYQYYIAIDGKVIQARSFSEEGAHTLGGWNRKSIGICCMGNFNITTLSEPQERSLAELINELQELHGIDNRHIYSHRELWSTECPGKNLQAWVEKYRATNFTFYEKKILRLQSAITELLNKLKLA